MLPGGSGGVAVGSSDNQTHKAYFNLVPIGGSYDSTLVTFLAVHGNYKEKSHVHEVARSSSIGGSFEKFSESLFCTSPASIHAACSEAQKVDGWIALAKTYPTIYF